MQLPGFARRLCYLLDTLMERLQNRLRNLSSVNAMIDMANTSEDGNASQQSILTYERM